MADRLDELLAFLRPDIRQDLRHTALEVVLGLTGSEDGCALIKQRVDSLSLLLDLMLDKEPAVARNAYLALVNLSAIEEFAMKLVSLGVLRRLLSLLTDPSWVHADLGCTLLANLTREPSRAEAFVKELTAPGDGPSLHQLVDIFDRRGFNSHAQLHYLATVFSNITQVAAARQLFLNRSKCILPRLLPYVQFKDSLIRRGGVVGLLRNLCFEVGELVNGEWICLFILLPQGDIHTLKVGCLSTNRQHMYLYTSTFQLSCVVASSSYCELRPTHCSMPFSPASHQWLLGDEVELLPALLLPLAGPEQFEEEVMEKLPLDLQYLSEEKERESDPDVRKMLLEALTKASYYRLQRVNAENSPCCFCMVWLAAYHLSSSQYWGQSTRCSLVTADNSISIRFEQVILRGTWRLNLWQLLEHSILDYWQHAWCRYFGSVSGCCYGDHELGLTATSSSLLPSHCSSARPNMAESTCGRTRPMWCFASCTAWRQWRKWAGLARSSSTCSLQTSRRQGWRTLTRLRSLRTSSHKALWRAGLLPRLGQQLLSC